MENEKDIILFHIGNCIGAIKECEKLLKVTTHGNIRNVLINVENSYLYQLRQYYSKYGLKSWQVDAILHHMCFIFNVLEPYHKRGDAFRDKATYNDMIMNHIYEQERNV